MGKRASSFIAALNASVITNKEERKSGLAHSLITTLNARVVTDKEERESASSSIAASQCQCYNKQGRQQQERESELGHLLRNLACPWPRPPSEDDPLGQTFATQQLVADTNIDLVSEVFVSIRGCVWSSREKRTKVNHDKQRICLFWLSTGIGCGASWHPPSLRSVLGCSAVGAAVIQYLWGFSIFEPLLKAGIWAYKRSSLKSETRSFGRVWILRFENYPLNKPKYVTKLGLLTSEVAKRHVLNQRIIIMERALGRRNRAEILGCVPSLQALEMGKN
ncbi:hypothetical protein J6590_039557 [Homalodisca vitripennis]|nr:hypothetical protein J6590_039557 [Homalodisca vitripennis]